MFGDQPRSITGRLPATPGRDARQGDALIDFQFSTEYARFVGRDHRVKVRGAHHWWRSRHWLAAVAAHPAVGVQIVNVLVPWLKDGDARTALKEGLDEDALRAWKVTCTRVAKELKHSHGATADRQAASPGAAGDAAAAC